MLKFSKRKADVNEATVLQPHNGYTDMSLQYENGLYSVEDSHTGLSQVSVESEIEVFIRDEEACHIEILKN